MKTACKFIYLLSISFIACNPSAEQKNDDPHIEKEEKPTLMIFAAAGLTQVISELVDSFEENYDIEIKTNFASSGILARQIEHGLVPDVYISASKQWADYVDSLGFVVAPYKSPVSINRLALIAPFGSPLEELTINQNLDIIALLGDERLSMGDPGHVPAGKYASEALIHYGWYDTLKSRLLPAKDVRSALYVVELGEAPLGIVYLSDAINSKRVKILDILPETAHSPIVFMASVCKDNPRAKKIYTFLNAPENDSIWERYGFIK